MVSLLAGATVIVAFSGPLRQGPLIFLTELLMDCGIRFSWWEVFGAAFSRTGESMISDSWLILLRLFIDSCLKFKITKSKFVFN